MLKNVKYVLTTHKIEEMPNDDLDEFVIVGRSNVGKSTFINTITNNSKLAKTSSKPGKTRAISFFDVNKEFRLVDIPGYGYAKVSKEQLISFSKMIDTYLKERKNIYKIILLLDIRRGITNHDQDMINFFINYKIPFSIVGTKKDKCNQKEISKFNKEIKEKLHTTAINFSSINKNNLKNVLDIFQIV